MSLLYGLAGFCVHQAGKHFSLLRSIIISLAPGIVTWIAFSQCAVEQRGVISSIYHNTTARYNGYYYAQEKIEEIETAIAARADDNYNQIPDLYPRLDTVLTRNYEKDAKEAIKMASLPIQRHPNSKWVYPCYVLVGLARLYTHDFKNAIQTFKYVNTKSADVDVRQRALIYLARTFIENEEYERAEMAFRLMEKDVMSKSNKKAFYLMRTYYYQRLKDYKQVAQSLLHADVALTRKDGKGRIYLIAGQVYQKIGMPQEAYRYYQRSIASNPPYKIDLYARLGLLQTTPLERKKNIKKVEKKFSMALEDAKNKEFKNKIYYEIASFYKKQGDKPLALDNYQYAMQAQGDPTVKGYAALQLARLYFDSLRNYRKAKDYYDSAISFLPKDAERYDRIAKRQQALKRLILYKDTVIWQDSLLHMAQADSTTLYTQLENTLKKRLARQQAIKEAKKKEEEQRRRNADAIAPSLQRSNTSPEWYFENPSMVSLGKIEFQQIWGSIPLEDDWRRSEKTIAIRPSRRVSNNTDTTSTNAPSTQEVIRQSLQDIFAQLPRTPEEKNEALRKVARAYFNIGEIFHFQLKESADAMTAYNTLLNRFPQSGYAPKALYRLYLLTAHQDTLKDNSYYQQLVLNYPNAEVTKTMLNPHYRKENELLLEKQKILYKAAYIDFKEGRIKSSQEKIDSASRLGNTSFVPQLDMLGILLAGQTEPLARYQAKLSGFIKRYPDHDLKAYAQALFTSSKKIAKELEGRGDIRYQQVFEGPHYVAVAYAQQGVIAKRVNHALDSLMRTGGNAAPSLKLGYRKLDKAHLITFVAGFPDATSALHLLDSFNAYRHTSEELTAYKLDAFVISAQNKNILQRTQALNAYIAFFNKNYKNKISTLPK